MDPVVNKNNEQTSSNNKNVLVHEIHENFDQVNILKFI